MARTHKSVLLRTVKLLPVLVIVGSHQTKTTLGSLVGLLSEKPTSEMIWAWADTLVSGGGLGFNVDTINPRKSSLCSTHHAGTGRAFLDTARWSLYCTQVCSLTMRLRLSSKSFARTVQSLPQGSWTQRVLWFITARPDSPSK